METHLEHLSQALKSRKKIAPSIEQEFLKFGQTAFDYLYQNIEYKKFNEMQKIKGLYLLFNLTRVHCYGKQKTLLNLSEQTLLADETEKVKEAAAIVATRLVDLGKSFPQLGITQLEIEQVLTTISELAKSNQHIANNTYLNGFLGKHLKQMQPLNFSA